MPGQPTSGAAAAAAAMPAAVAAAAAASIPAGSAGTDDAWLALRGVMLGGFSTVPDEQAYQQWRQQRVRQLAPLTLGVQSTIILLPCAALSLHALVWLRGRSLLAALFLPVLQSSVSHVPAVAHLCRPDLYVRHHDLLWTVTAAISSLLVSACWSSGVMAFMKEAGAGSLLRNMLMPGILMYIVMPALLQTGPRWQLLISVNGCFVICVISATIAAEGAAIAAPTHVALVALSVVISSVMEWRSLVRWLRASRAAVAAAAMTGPGLAVPVNCAAEAGPASTRAGKA